jgi:hypothetical protein
MIDSQEWGPGSAGAIDFEARMRRRRFMHCVRQATGAIASGDVENGRIALDEARALFPDAPELAVLDARIAAGGDGLAMPTTTALPGLFDDDDMSDALESLFLRAEDPAETRLRGEGAVARGRLPRAIVPLAVTGLLGFGLGQLSATRLELVKPADLSAWASAMLVAILDTPTPDIPQPPRPPAVPPPASGGEEPARLDPPLTPTATSGETTTQSSQGETTTQSSQPEAGGNVAPLADDEEIRAVLKRYEVAYNRLQAKAARSESRRDNGSSQPAFDSLLARQISLGVCDITKSGEVSTATCTGTTALDPRSGGGGRTHRFWAFDLRRNSDGWRVERLTVN